MTENQNENIECCESSKTAICKQCELNLSSRVKANMMIISENIRLKMAEKKLENNLKENALYTINLKETLATTVSKNNELENTIQALEQFIFSQQVNKPILSTQSSVKNESPQSSFISKTLSSNLDIFQSTMLSSSDSSDAKSSQAESLNNINQLDIKDLNKNNGDTKLIDIIKQLYTQQIVTNKVICDQNLQLVFSNSKYSSILNVLYQVRKNINDMQNLLLENLHEKEQHREELEELLTSFIEIEEELITNRNENQFKDDKIEILNKVILQNSITTKKIQQENDVLKLELQTATLRYASVSSSIYQSIDSTEKLRESTKHLLATKLKDQSNEWYNSVTVYNSPCLNNLSNTLRSSDPDCYPLSSTYASTAYKKNINKTVNNVLGSQIISFNWRENLQANCDWSYFAEQIEIISQTVQNLEIRSHTCDFKKWNKVDMLRIRLRLNVLIELMTKKKKKEKFDTQFITKSIDITQLIEIAKKVYENFK